MIAQLVQRRTARPRRTTPPARWPCGVRELHRRAGDLQHDIGQGAAQFRAELGVAARRAAAGRLAVAAIRPVLGGELQRGHALTVPLVVLDG